MANISYDADEGDLRNHFVQKGHLPDSVKIKRDDFGKSRGFGFVEIDGGVEAKRATEDLNGTELRGRKLTVDAARPRPERDHDFGNEDRPPRRYAERGRFASGGNRW